MAFTEIAANTDLQDTDLLNELTAGINERALACGGTGVDAVIIGDDVQAATFWAGLQSAVEGLIERYMPPDFDPTDYAETGFPDSYTLEDALADAGYASGVTSWRRVPGENWPTSWVYSDDPVDAAFSAYGQMQAGDIIGPWLYEDIERVLSQLSVVLVRDVFDDYAPAGVQSNGEDTVQQDAFDACIADWSQADTPTLEYAYYVMRGWTLDAITPNYTYLTRRYWSFPQVEINVPTGATCDWDWYIFPKSGWDDGNPEPDPYYSPDEITIDAGSVNPGKWRGPMASDTDVTGTPVDIDITDTFASGCVSMNSVNGTPDNYSDPMVEIIGPPSYYAPAVDGSSELESHADSWYCRDCWRLTFDFVWVMAEE